MSVPTCNHIHDDGRACGSTALHDQEYCYFHDRLRQRPRRRQVDGKLELNIFELESIESIKIATTHVMQALADDLIDSRKANALYRGIALMLSALRLEQRHASTTTDSHPTTPEPASCHTERSEVPLP